MLGVRTKSRTLIRRSLLRIGRCTTASQLANLRSVLSYVELGRWLKLEHARESPLVVGTDFELFDIAVDRIVGARPLYLEFGVFEGRSLRWWSEHLSQPGATLVGFDSFEGLPDSWRPGLGIGAFKTGQSPRFDDERVSLQVGWFDVTLPDFVVPEHDQLIINIDSDLYSSAATVLEWAEPILEPGSLLYFDEFPDRDHEMRAFNELRARSAFTFTPVAIAQGGLHWLFVVN
jgi:hypothetical protein